MRRHRSRLRKHQHPRVTYPLTRLCKKLGLPATGMWADIPMSHIAFTCSRRRLQIHLVKLGHQEEITISQRWGAGCFKELKSKIALVVQ